MLQELGLQPHCEVSHELGRLIWNSASLTPLTLPHRALGDSPAGMDQSSIRMGVMASTAGQLSRQLTDLASDCIGCTEMHNS